jgi:hypothetical protein
MPFLLFFPLEKQAGIGTPVVHVFPFDQVVIKSVRPCICSSPHRSPRHHVRALVYAIRIRADARNLHLMPGFMSTFNVDVLCVPGRHRPASWRRVERRTCSHHRPKQCACQSRILAHPRPPLLQLCSISRGVAASMRRPAISAARAIGDAVQPISAQRGAKRPSLMMIVGAREGGRC